MGAETPVWNRLVSSPASSDIQRSTFGWYLHGAVTALSVPGLVLFAGYMGYGGLLQAVDFPIIAGLLSTLLVWALPAQIILVGSLASGTGLLAVALAIGLSSLRLFPMVMAIAPFLRSGRRNMARDLLCAHFVAMTVWVEGQRLLPRMRPEGRPAFVLGLGCGLLTISLLGTAGGFVMAGELPKHLAIGLLFLTPISFSVFMVRGASDVTDWVALAVGFCLTPFVAGLGGGMDLMLSGVGGGTLAYAVGRFRRHRRA